MDFMDFFDTLLIERTTYSNDDDTDNDVDNDEDDKYNY